LPFVFCLAPDNAFARATGSISPSAASWLAAILSPPLLLLQLTLLFRLLGSSADEYFAPPLSMFSSELGLPPRFAGATLLAVGNGACDVSAAVNAIAPDSEYGYLMSLGGLTGGGMFVSTVVSGCVILAAGGVACRGALIGDVTALGVAASVVACTLGGASSARGRRGCTRRCTSPSCRSC
jgi:sodium/potassium/calcium exchanger 6